MRAIAVGYAIADQFGEIDGDTIRGSERRAIEAWVRNKAEVSGAISQIAIDALWERFSRAYGAQCIEVTTQSDEDITPRQPVLTLPEV